MKYLLKLIIFIVIILTSAFFYNSIKVNETSLSNLDTINIINHNSKPINNNEIKDLKYEIVLNNKAKYIVRSNESKLNYIDGYEYVDMSNVMAKVITKDNNRITIDSKYANYMSKNHNTNFYENVKLTYLEDTLECEKIFLNFKDQFILVEGNVRYKTNKSLVKADIIKIDLLTNKIEILMKKNKDKIKIFTN